MILIMGRCRCQHLINYGPLGICVHSACTWGRRSLVFSARWSTDFIINFSPYSIVSHLSLSSPLYLCLLPHIFAHYAHWDGQKGRMPYTEFVRIGYAKCSLTMRSTHCYQILQFIQSPSFLFLSVQFLSYVQMEFGLSRMFFAPLNRQIAFLVSNRNSTVISFDLYSYSFHRFFFKIRYLRSL